MTLELERPGFEPIAYQLCGLSSYLLRGSIFNHLYNGFTDPELIRQNLQKLFKTTQPD